MASCEGRAVRGFAPRANLRLVSGSGKSEATFGNPKPKFSTHSFGCHFVEVTWQPEIARLRVSRVVTVIDAGRIINPLAGRNQIEGAVVMGIGMALFEHTTYDPQNGAPINSNLADYIVAVNADAPPIDVHFLDYPRQRDQRTWRARDRRDRPGRHRRRHHGGGPPRDRRSRARTAGEDRGVVLLDTR
jgi:CO/xanthine dehydrogenase Mo-binding subunit